MSGKRARHNVVTLEAVRRQQKITTEKVLREVFDDLVESDTHEEFVIRFWCLVEGLSPELGQKLRRRCDLGCR